MEQADSARAADDRRNACIGAGAPIDVDEAWQLLLALRRCVDEGAGPGAAGGLGFRFGGRGCVRADPARADLVLRQGGEIVLRGLRPLDAAARALLELHLPQALASREAGHVVALLGQTLDGFIATREGHSRYINGPVSLVHLHRLRALSDAVVIGVGTAVADGPRLTTRHVPGPHPVRVVIDPRGRLSADCGLLQDGAGPTLVIRGTRGEPFAAPLSPQATALHLPAGEAGIEPRAIIAALARRGLTRLLIEGGGLTVSRFLEAGLLDRLQLAVSPLVLGAGRPALPVAPVDRLDRALRPPCRSHPMGEDVLFDLDLRGAGRDEAGAMRGTA
jgi:riboflavin-specific deaminase-like protein